MFIKIQKNSKVTSIQISGSSNNNKSSNCFWNKWIMTEFTQFFLYLFFHSDIRQRHVSLDLGFLNQSLPRNIKHSDMLSQCIHCNQRRSFSFVPTTGTQINTQKVINNCKYLAHSPGLLLTSCYNLN